MKSTVRKFDGKDFRLIASSDSRPISIPDSLREQGFLVRVTKEESKDNSRKPHYKMWIRQK